MRTVPYRVEQTFRVKPAAREIASRAMQAIDSVHGIDALSDLTFDRRRLRAGWEGQFDPYRRTATLSTQTVYPLATSVHEIGHALDALNLVHVGKLGRLNGPITYFASQYAASFTRGPLIDWFDAVIGSRSVAELFAAVRTSRFGSEDYNEAVYYSDFIEVWARSYEQFIAQRTHNLDLRQEFRRKRNKKVKIGDRRIRVYWTHAEFEPVDKEITKLFRSLGWM